jgi:hypothetical protein
MRDFGLTFRTIALVAVIVLSVIFPTPHRPGDIPGLKVFPLIGFVQLVEARQRLKSKSSELSKVFEEAGTEMDFTKVKCLGDNLTTVAKAERVKAMNDELTAIGVEIDTLEAVKQSQAALDAHNRKAADPNFRSPGGGNGRDSDAPRKSLGQMFVESVAYTNRPKSGGGQIITASIPANVKTLFERSNGWSPESLRTGLVVPFAATPIQVAPLIPTVPTTMAAYKYMEETTQTFTDVVEKDEGDSFGEIELELTERTITVEKIPASIPVTDEQLEDVGGVQAYIDNRLEFAIRRRLDRQILLGDGSSPNLIGILNKAGIQTQAKGGDPVPDAIRKAITKVATIGQAAPNLVVLNPNDWQDVRLLKTADGIYIWGAPSEAGPARIWGLTVAEVQVLTENTGLVGDFANFIQLVVRADMEMEIGYVNDDFVKGRKTIRARIRVANAILRPSAFCTVTGI